ncbi:ATP-binding protein, partial [Klebsiella quasipneumoniae]|uniref:ATP-binding protein n=1 Tax=Klebsiella quasipneumoniae TaxID=1463165 RepID=UPI0021154CC3
RLPGVIFFCISDTLVPTTYLVDTTLSDASDYDQTVHAVRLQLLQELRKARAQLKLNELLLKLDRYRVIVVDDLGYVKRDNAETGVLFELIAHRYERGSLVITSNHPFSTWGSIFVDETMAVAAADRLIHHGYMFELKGESYRKKTAKAVTSAT